MNNGFTLSAVIRAVAVAALLLVLGGVVGAVVIYNFVHTSISTSPEAVIFDVRPGDTFKAVTNNLKDAGLIANAPFFQIFARATRTAAKIRVGQYSIRRNANPAEIIAIISSGKSIEYPLTVQEGFNIFEIAERVQDQGIASKSEFISLVRNPDFIMQVLGERVPSLEGYLFPETYNITKFTSAQQLVHMMVARFKENFAKVQRLGKSALTRHELVTLASIIEKETGASFERPLISSVFHNRLRKNMRLETDPTVIYGIWQQSGEWNRNISRADLTTPNRYNTYTFTGLPYGPISNPGFAALRAALLPEQSEYLFFVSRNDGTHVFSVDYAGHLSAVKSFQQNAKAREGKSWRDLKQSKDVNQRKADGAVGGF